MSNAECPISNYQVKARVLEFSLDIGNSKLDIGH